MEIKKDSFLNYINKYRGILAVTVLLSHTWAYTGFEFLLPFNKIVTIAVFIFLFMSGAGLEKSNDVKANYYKHIWREKIPKLCLMAAEAYVFSCILEYAVSVFLQYNIKQYIPFSANNFFINTNWYIYELLLFYILFSILSKLELKARIGFLWIFSIIFFFLFYFYAPVEAYYDSIIGFTFGVSYSHIRNYNKKSEKISLFIVVVAIVVSAVCMLSGNTQNIWFAVIRNIMGICAVFILWEFSNRNMKFNRLFDATINKKICEISPELYFFHIPICAVIGVSVKNVYLRTVIILVGSFVTAILFNKIHKYIRKRRK